MSFPRSLIVFIISIIGLISGYYQYPHKGIHEQFEGSIPFIWNRNFNLTVCQYCDARPSPSVLLIGGGYKSGKSRLIEMISKEKIESGRFVIKFDAGIADSLEDLLVTLKLAMSKAIINVESYGLTPALIKSAEKLSGRTISGGVSEATSALYKIFESDIDGMLVDESKFSTTRITKLFDDLEEISDYLNPIIFVHNFDSIRRLKSSKFLDIADKALKVLGSYVSRRNNYEQSIPIILEIKNSLELLNLRELDTYRYFEVTKLDNVIHHYVIENQAFSLSQLKKITSIFGAHAGSIAKIYNDMKYNIKLDESINLEIKKLEKIITSKINLQDSNITKMFCTKSTLSDISTLEKYKALFEEGFLYLSKSLDIKIANKAIKRILCNK